MNLRLSRSWKCTRLLCAAELCYISKRVTFGSCENYVINTCKKISGMTYYFLVNMHVARVGEERGLYRVLVGKSEWKRPLGRPRRRWVDNIRMDLQEVGCGYMDWFGLVQDRERWRTLVSAVMNLRVPWNVGNFLTSCKPVSFSGRTLHHGVSNCPANKEGLATLRK